MTRFLYSALVLMFLIGTKTQAQVVNDYLHVGAGSAGMGNIGTTYTDTRAAWGNQGGLAMVEKSGVEVYGSKLYWGTSLMKAGLAGVYKTEKLGCFSVVVNHFGSQDYQQQRFGVGYGKLLAKGFSMGIQLNYFMFRFSDLVYPSGSALGFEGGFLGQVSKKVTLGAHVFNPIRTRIGTNDFLPGGLKLGVLYKPNDKLNLHSDVVKEFNRPLCVRLGLEYLATKKVLLRTGLVSEPLLMTLGLGLKLNNLYINLASGYQLDLGAQSSVGLGYVF